MKIDRQLVQECRSCLKPFQNSQKVFKVFFTLYYVRNIKMTPISFRNNFYYLKKKTSLKKENYRIPFD